MPEFEFQKWRAIAIFPGKKELLLFLGKNSPHVKQNYKKSFSWLVTDEQAKSNYKIQLQRWKGRSDIGCWETIEELEKAE